MKKYALPLLLPMLPLLLAACLELTPNIATDFSEIEARAAFEETVRSMCDHKKARIPAILAGIKTADAVPTIDHWIFTVEDMETQVFASGLVTGDYHRHIRENLCR